MTVNILMQKNYTIETPTTYTGTQSSESTIDSDGTNIPTAYMIERPWVLTTTVSSSATIGSSPVSYSTDYRLDKTGNSLTIIPLTVWDSGSSSDNAVTYDYLATHVPGNEINDSFKDGDYYYLATNKGLSVIRISDEEVQGWVEREGGYTCVYGIGNYVYLGTDDAGIYYLLKNGINGLVTPTLAYSTGTTPAIADNEIKDIMCAVTTSGTTLLAGTDSSCEIIYGVGPTGGTRFTRSGDSIKVWLSGEKVYQILRVSSSDSIELLDPIPGADWSSSTKTFNMSSTPALTYNHMNTFYLTNETSVSGTGDTMFIGYNYRGLDILSINETDYSGSDVDHIERAYNTPYVVQFDTDSSYHINNLYENLSIAEGPRAVAGVTLYNIYRDGNGDIWLFSHSGSNTYLRRYDSYTLAGLVSKVLGTYSTFRSGCIDRNNEAFVGYAGASARIRKYDTDGNYLTEMTSILVNQLSVGRDNNIFVVIDASRYVKKVYNDLSGTDWTSAAWNSGYSSRGSAVDNNGHLWVIIMDSTFAVRVLKYDGSNGDVLLNMTLGSSTYDKGYGIGVDKDGYIWCIFGETAGADTMLISKIDPVSHSKVLNGVDLGFTYAFSACYLSGGDDGYMYGYFRLGSSLYGMAKINGTTGAVVDTVTDGGVDSGIYTDSVNGDLTGLAWQRLFGPARSKPFMGNSAHVTSVKASSNASRDTGLLYIGTASSGNNKGAFTKLRLSDREVLSFAEFKESSTLEVV